MSTIARLAARLPLDPRALAALAAVVLVALLVVAVLLPGSSAAPVTVAAPTPSPTAMPAPTRTPAPTASPTPTPTATPTPVPTPTPIYEDLSGVPTTAELAHRYPIAVMLDDAPAARPQSGLSAASVVWQAPVEGGIPRYMAVFQAGEPPAIGPVRSARFYFVKWAAEWKALYLHAGGPPVLKLWLRGSQDLVVNADGKRTARIDYRAAPHNLYSEGPKLRRYAATIGAADADLAYDPLAPGVLQPFADGAALDARGPDGGTIRIQYMSERVDYAYDRASNTWLRSVDRRPQHDALGKRVGGSNAAVDGPRIAPTTVVVMQVAIRRSARIEGPAKGRLEADSIGTGRAWVFADGRLTPGTWSKKNDRARTRFLDADGAEIVLPRGQLFIQVVSASSALTFDVASAE